MDAHIWALTFILKCPEYVLLYHHHCLAQDLFGVQVFLRRLALVKDVDELYHRLSLLLLELDLLRVLLGVGLEVGCLVAELQLDLVQVWPLLVLDICAQEKHNECRQVLVYLPKNFYFAASLSFGFIDGFFLDPKSAAGGRSRPCVG